MSSGKVKGVQYYSKINTCFKRDMDHSSKFYNCIQPNETLSTPELDYFRKVGLKFEATEKIDGECTSIHLIPHVNCQGQTWKDIAGNEHWVIDHYTVEVHGKTSAASMRTEEVELLQKIGDLGTLLSIFSQKKTITNGEQTQDVVLPPESEIIIFGETYGKRMQKVGNRYDSQKLNFICFDIKIGNIWLMRDSIEDICNKLNIQAVPFIGMFTIDEAIEYVRKGFKSTISEDSTLEAEGLVLKAPLGILTRLGGRIITKIKTKDFQDLERATNS